MQGYTNIAIRDVVGLDASLTMVDRLRFPQGAEDRRVFHLGTILSSESRAWPQIPQQNPGQTTSRLPRGDIAMRLRLVTGTSRLFAEGHGRFGLLRSSTFE